jgi:hypothetical protein
VRRSPGLKPGLFLYYSEIPDLFLMEKFRSKVQELLQERFGIAVSDCLSEDQIDQAYTNGETAEELTGWLARKYDLTSIQELYH